MLLALTVWNGRISPVCDVAKSLLLLNVAAGKVINRREERLNAENTMQQARVIAELNPDVLVCGAISNSLAALLSAKKIRILPFVMGTEDEIVSAFLNGLLPSPNLTMPGCRGRGFGNRGCRGRGRRRGGGRGSRLPSIFPQAGPTPMEQA